MIKLQNYYYLFITRKNFTTFSEEETETVMYKIFEHGKKSSCQVPPKLMLRLCRKDCYKLLQACAEVAVAGEEFASWAIGYLKWVSVYLRVWIVRRGRRKGI